MTQTPSSFPKNTENLVQALEEHPAIHWISTNGRAIFGGFIVLVALAILGLRLSAYNFKSNESSALKALQSADFLEHGDLSDELAVQQSVAQLKEAVASHSALEINYGGLLAQWLLNQGESQAAQSLGQAAIRRTEKDNAPFYSGFSQATLLWQDKPAEALLAVEKLQQEMNAHKESSGVNYGPVLYAYNSLRAILLHLQLGERDEAAKQWAAWKQDARRSLAEGSNLAEGYDLVAGAFQIGQLSLSEWLDQQLK